MIEVTGRGHQLRFRSLSEGGSAFVFPCDGRGQVDIDGLCERARINYFYARAMVGRELAVPRVEPAAPEA